jgi:hypothetical protein
VNPQDAINGAFELCGGFLLFLHCRKVIQDREIKGVSWIPVAFFAGWGYWNLYYYPHLNQTLSFIGGIVVVFANTLWLALIFRFRKGG